VSIKDVKRAEAAKRKAQALRDNLKRRKAAKRKENTSSEPKDTAPD